jgi:hypothetical protein
VTGVERQESSAGLVSSCPCRILGCSSVNSSLAHAVVGWHAVLIKEDVTRVTSQWW